MYRLVFALAVLGNISAISPRGSGDTPPDLDAKIAAVLPTPEEDAFLRIPWRFNILQARSESSRTGKPLFIWSMNGHPLGHT
jgi:hypothetical protein